MTLTEAIVYVLLAAVVAFGIYVTVEQSNLNKEYKAVCVKQGGTPVHDGRQWQCIGDRK
jgi:hypothetical protein